MKKAIGMFGDPKGDVSSKRITSVACFIVAFVLAFTTKDVAMASLFAGCGVTLQGVAMIGEKGLK